MINFEHADELALPQMDFAGWFHTVGRWQGITIALSFACCVAFRIIYKKMRRPRPGELTFTLRREGRVMWLTFLFSFIGVGLGFALFAFFHTGVQKFFLPVSVCFWSSLAIQPAISFALAIYYKAPGAAAVAFAPMALAGYMLFIEPNRLEVLRGEITIPTLPPGCVIKITHFSDIQTVDMGGREIEALRASNAFEPDMVVITGDLTASGFPSSLVEQYIAFRKQLKTKTSVYVVNGDSDGDFDNYAKKIGDLTFLKDSGIEVSVNGARLWLAGVDNTRRPPDPTFGLAKAPPGVTRILLTHNPDRFFAEGGWHAEFGMAGHTHGGQVVIPGYGAPITFTKLGRRYAEGLFDKSKLDPEIPFKVDAFTVCGGLGMEGGFAPRIRFMRPPQIILLTLRGPRG
ncbi:MAG: metallophosphoesterase [Planctomycetes bacterium]|nr:metallophosphoesterase [Planctomycetota bacterium]